MTAPFAASATSLITSRLNPRVQELVRLRERNARREHGRFLIEGLRELSRAFLGGTDNPVCVPRLGSTDNPVCVSSLGSTGNPACASRGTAAKTVRVSEVYYCPALFKNAPAAHRLLETARAHGATLCELGENAFEKVSGREGADGLLGVAPVWDVTLDALALPPTPLLLVVEAVEKPGNLGSLFRTADSAGCAALLCCDPVVDVFNASVVRASQGALFSMPFAVASAAEIAAFLARHEISVFATTPAADALYWDADFRTSAAILLGSEKDGLSPFWLDGGAARAGVRTVPVSIPQAGLSDSLNVGMAGAICLFEAVRQRSKRP